MSTAKKLATDRMLETAARAVFNHDDSINCQVENADWFRGKTHVATSRSCLHSGNKSDKTVFIVSVSLFTYEEFAK